ncbi:MAG TPA: hypothetical protein VN457_07685, partial [Chlamydiales bacterium]|nr:hypothetical protein [Chlamydiales bacterium]
TSQGAELLERSDCPLFFGVEKIEEGDWAHSFFAFQECAVIDGIFIPHVELTDFVHQLSLAHFKKHALPAECTKEDEFNFLKPLSDDTITAEGLIQHLNHFFSDSICLFTQESQGAMSRYVMAAAWPENSYFPTEFSPLSIAIGCALAEGMRPKEKRSVILLSRQEFEANIQTYLLAQKLSLPLIVIVLSDEVSPLDEFLHATRVDSHEELHMDLTRALKVNRPTLIVAQTMNYER